MNSLFKMTSIKKDEGFIKIDEMMSEDKELPSGRAILGKSFVVTFLPEKIGVRLGTIFVKSMLVKNS